MPSRRDQRNELTARLDAVCSELAAELGVEPPVCRITATRQVRAGVWLTRYGGRGLLYVSRGAMERLDPMALRWLVAHELGHVADEGGRHRLRVGRRLCLLTVVLFTGLAMVTPSGPLLGLALIVANGVIGSDIRRRLEDVADATAHRLCAADPDAGRRALTAARPASRLSGPLFRLTERLVGYPPLHERVDPARA